MTFTVELNCTEVQGFTITHTFVFTGNLAVAGDWSLGFDIPYTYSDGTSARFVWNGKLAVPGNASGTLKISVVFQNVPDVGVVHCQTGDTPMTWTAAVG